MKNIFATFGLSSKMRIRRLAVGFFVVAVLVTVSLFIIKSNKEDADAATADGAKVTVGWDTDTGTISSFGPGTYKWSIGSSTAFCLNPNKTDGPEGGTRHAKMYNGSTAASKLKANMIKLAIYGYTRDNQYGDAIMNDMLGSTSRSNTAYAKIHMAIGYIWEGDDAISALSSSEKTLVQNMAAVLQSNVEGQSNPWVVAKNWQLYIIDPKDIDATREQNIAWIENTMDYGSINVQKCDSVNTTCNAPGNANFANVHFLLQYTGSERLYNPRKLEFYDPGQVIREGTTNASGSLSFTDLNLTSYKVIENGGSNTSLILNQSEKTATLSSTNKTVNLTFKNQVVRGDVSFFKHSDNGEPMANIPFKITSKTTGESHIVVSDSEGLVSTESVSPRLHSNHTNGYDSSESNPSSITYKGYGTWFGRDGSNASPVRNDLGALPYDTYEIVEISCNQNQFCYDITSQKKTFTIANEHETISLGNWENDCVEFKLGTTATDNEDGDKIVSAKSNAVIKDHVVYTAMKNKTFTVKGVLMDKNTHQPVKNNGANVEKSVTVTPTTSEQGSIDVLFTVDTTAYKGHEIVIFEYLYYGSELVKSHEDYNDSAQTISVYYLGTNATDAIDGNKSIAADAMGIDETSISWDSISLSNGPEGMFMMMNGHPGMPGHRGMMPEALCGPDNSYDCPGGQGNHWGRGGNWDRDNHWGRGNGPYGGPRGGHHYQGDQGQHHRQFSGDDVAEATANTDVQQDNNKENPFQFHPVYNVICEANDVRYFLHIDAVNGHVFKCNVGRK